MTWWQWPFFCLGIVTALSLALILAVTALHLLRGVWAVMTTVLGRLSAAPKPPRATGTATTAKAPASVTASETPAPIDNPAG
jgi:hypothetical protein